MDAREFARFYMQIDTMTRERTIELVVKGIESERSRTEVVEYRLAESSTTIEAEIDGDHRITEPFDEQVLLARMNSFKPTRADGYFRAVVGEVPQEAGLYTMRFVCSYYGEIEYVEQKVWIVNKESQTELA